MFDLRKAVSPNKGQQGLDTLVEKGEITVIIGGSGCWKRGILKDIISVLMTDKGNVFIEGVNITTIKEGNVLYSIRSAGADNILNNTWRRGYVGAGVRFEDEDFKHLFVTISGLPKNKNA